MHTSHLEHSQCTTNLPLIHTFKVRHLFCHLYHLVEPGLDLLSSLLENLHQLLGLFGIGGGKKRVGRPSFLGTSCSANAMHIVLSVVWKVKVNDKLDVRHIYKCNNVNNKGKTTPF